VDLSTMAFEVFAEQSTGAKFANGFFVSGWFGVVCIDQVALDFGGGRKHFAAFGAHKMDFFEVIFA
jgi:hypothetical protein